MKESGPRGPEPCVDGHLARPSRVNGTGVVVLHAFWGLSRAPKDACDRLARSGFTAFAPDLFEGRTTDDPRAADHLRRSRFSEPVYRKVVRAFECVAEQDGVSRVGAVGFSYGGHWALWLAANAPAPLAGVVTYYATRATDLRGTPVLAHFAEVDPYVSASGRTRFEKVLPLGSRSHDYPGTSHWFAELDRTEYDEQAARLAWRRTVAFLRR